MKKEDQILAMLKEIRDLLAGSTAASASRKRGAQTRRDGAEALGAESLSDRMVRSNEDASEWHPIWDKGKPLDRWLAVLAVAEKEIGANTALSGSEIAQVAKDRFRLSGVYATNISRDLKRQRKFVSSAKRGTGYEYRLTRDGLKHVGARRDQLAKTGVADAPTRRTRKARQVSKPTAGRTPRKVATKPGAPRKKATGGRPGPKAMLEDLIAMGYFKSARTITEVQEHLQRQRGHRYTAQDLSPALVRLLRSGALSRDTNTDGTYEYHVG